MRHGQLKTFSALAHRNFRLFYWGGILSRTGDFMQTMAQSWLVLVLTNSPFDLGLIGFCQAAPRLLVGPVAGVIADRFDRRYLQIYMQTIAMVQSFVFAVLVATGWIRFWHIVVLVLILGFSNSLNQVAKQSLISSLVPREDLSNAVALNSSLNNLTRIAGPSLGGILLGVIGVAGLLFLNGFSFVFALLSLFLMDLPREAPRRRTEHIRADLAEGVHFVLSRRSILLTILLAYMVAAFGNPYMRFLPIWAKDILKIGPQGFGVLMAAPGLGALVAALVLATLGNMRKRHRTIFAMAASFGVMIAVFGYSRNLVLSLTALFLAGFSQMAFRTLANSTIQLAIPDYIRGRVMSIFFLDIGMLSIGTLFVGVLMEATSPTFALGLGGSVCLLSACGFWFLYRRGTPARLDAESPQPGAAAGAPRGGLLEEEPSSTVFKSEDL